MSAVAEASIFGAGNSAPSDLSPAGALDRAQALHLGAQQAADAEALGDGHQHARAGVAQNSGLPAQMILDLGHPRGRIDRNRDRAGEQDAEEGR